MTTHLEMAQRALVDAAALDVDLSSDRLPATYTRLLDLAAVQSGLAQAEALERIANSLQSLGDRFQDFCNYPTQVEVVKR